MLTCFLFSDLQKLGGFSVLVRILNHSVPEIRTAAAWVLGKASQNNPIVQKQVLELCFYTSLVFNALVSLSLSSVQFLCLYSKFTGYCIDAVQ